MVAELPKCGEGDILLYRLIFLFFKGMFLKKSFFCSKSVFLCQIIHNPLETLKIEIMEQKIKKEHLKAFSGEHLYYELNMFFGLSKLLRKGVNDQYVYSAILESFVIHTCLILDFFYKPPRKEDDASVLHFIDDVRKWKRLRPSYDKYFRKFHRRRSREVVHLSYKRLEVEKSEKLWNTGKIVPSVRQLLSVFFEVANPEFLHPNMHKLKHLIKETL